MSRHSKNNTASAVFTYNERKQLSGYGTLRQRLGTESQRAFEKCNICLGTAVEPKACEDGHMFCSDCIVENLVA